MSATTPLIPRQVLFGNPERMQLRLSPDGSKLSFLAPLNGVLNVWVGPADDLQQARAVTADTHRGIRFHGWAYTNRHVLYLQDKDGDENWHLYAVDLESGETRDLTPVAGVQARVEATSPRFPNQVMVGLNDRDPSLHDVYRVDLATGERRLVEENQGFLGFVIDLDFQLRFALRMTEDGGLEMLRRPGAGQWESYQSIGMEDTLTTQPIGLDATGETLYMTDSRDRNTAALTAVKLAEGERQVLAEDALADAGGVLVHPTELRVQAVAFTYERERWEIIDPAVADDLAYLRTVADGELEVASRTLDDRLWAVAYTVADGPLRYYLYDRQQRQARFLFTNRPALEQYSLANMYSAVVPARDGLKLVCYYTLPAASDTARPGHPEQPRPLVLLVHGGPWARDDWGYHTWHQWLANRGYAVLSVNYRGSTGFGKAFINAGNYQWSRKMHEDLLDALEWAIQQGLTDRDQIAIMGGSYGGYATLVGLTFTPEMFTCGVDMVGPSNLITLLESVPPYWKPMLEMFFKRVGDHRTEEGRQLLLEASPLTHVDRIRRPLLIGQGANDPRVKQAESDQIVRAMQEKSIPVTYVVYSDEGHGFARPENNMSFFAISEAFLARCLKGRYEPVGKDFEGSSVKVPIGAAEVPGLAEALR